MYGLNAVALVFFFCINIIAYRLCKCDAKKRKKVIFAACIALLSLNVIRYAIVYPFIMRVVRIPVEFSTVAYFSVPVVLLSGKKKMRGFAAYSGLMAGFFYYMAMIVAGGALYASYPPYNIYISMLCHGTIYLCGFVTVGTEVFCKKEAPMLAVGVALVAVRAALLRPLVVESEKLLIYILLDAVCVKKLLPQSAWTYALPLYYIVISALILLTIRGFFSKNKKQYDKFLGMRKASLQSGENRL